MLNFTYNIMITILITRDRTRDSHGDSESVVTESGQSQPEPQRCGPGSHRGATQPMPPGLPVARTAGGRGAPPPAVTVTVTERPRRRRRGRRASGRGY